jgi:hypothetical protein
MSKKRETCNHEVDEYGNQYWYKDGEYHRGKDLPAIIWVDGRQDWYQNGKIHRGNDKPAVIFADGRKQWWTKDRYIKSEKAGK